MSIYDNLPGPSPTQRVWGAVIASAPPDFADRLAVIIPGLDPNLRWEDCRWQARNTIDLPQRGDECVVVIDDNGEFWVVAWWPY